MPAWWKGKFKSKSKSAPSSASSLWQKAEGGRRLEAEEEEEEEENPTPKHGRATKKEKANSFDEVLVARKTRDISPVNGCGGDFAFGHPLPRPSISSPLPSIAHDHGAVTPSGSAFASSVSSSGSSDEIPDLGFYRYSEAINMPRDRNMTPGSQRQQHVTEDRHLFLGSPISEHPKCSETPASPKKEAHLYGTDASSHRRASTDTMFSPAMASSPPASRGHPFPTSPMHQRAFGKCPGSPTQRQDDLRSPPQPLPLPPGSPSCSSSSSRSLQSQWKKGKLLGRGTFGHVYLGFNSESGQMCAIKEVPVISDDSNSKECLKQLGQEIALLSQLSHPNIVQYYGSEWVDDALSVYLEYVSGGSIHKLLQEYGPFREPVIRNYTRQILSGLVYLHGRNTVHRDIKGANILVDPNGDVRLADFGMAKHISSYTSIRSFKGSPYWMAPEVIMNGSGYNLSVDIWSLGCTILEMATSKPPWSQFEGVAAIFKIGNSKDIPEIPDHISLDGKSFLKQCLQRDPSARPTAAQLMDHPFVRDQAILKAAKPVMTRDMLLAPDGSHPMTTSELSPNRSLSPLRNREYGMGHVGFPLALKYQSDFLSMRVNMSLPVSPCSSPLRQFKQSNRSCLPSPPHPAYSAGAINYGPNNYALYPMKPSNNNILDPWPDIPKLKVQSPYDSPRR